jgi:hypothetical protein
VTRSWEELPESGRIDAEFIADRLYGDLKKLISERRAPHDGGQIMKEMVCLD